MQPRQMRDTSKPVRLSFTYSITARFVPVRAWVDQPYFLQQLSVTLASLWSHDQRLYIPHEAVHRVQELGQIAIAVEIDLKRVHPRFFAVTQ